MIAATYGQFTDSWAQPSVLLKGVADLSTEVRTAPPDQSERRFEKRQ